jgi:hypothetical protein
MDHEIASGTRSAVPSNQYLPIVIRRPGHDGTHLAVDDEGGPRTGREDGGAVQAAVAS